MLLHDEADANWHQPVSFFDESISIPPALAMIQPWHPGLMYLMYSAITEEEMLEHRRATQPIPAGRRPADEENAGEAILEVHLTLCIYTKCKTWEVQVTLCIYTRNQDSILFSY